MRLLPLCFLLLIGCGGGGPTRTDAEKDKGQMLLIAALDSWQKNEAKPSGDFAFTEEWRKTHQLIEHKIGKSSVPDERTIAYAVSLKLKNKKGELETREVSYLVMFGSPNRIARDPYN